MREVAGLIPHAGSMCLLDKIVAHRSRISNAAAPFF
jgi:predicted hotdog family 3-hydroxylacyl-ACP dehydratase